MNTARIKARAKARRAYWLNGGEKGNVGEPSPGTPKYEKEEADKIRNTEDKQMVGEPLETGSEDLFPGDAEKLKEVNRDGMGLKAELEERALRRRSYWQGGEGINLPTPGKEKYPKEEADKIRNTEDKQMTGTYDMGGTEGTVKEDMQVKEKLLRAKLRAKFTKVADDAGSLRKDASRWDFYAGDKLILTATGEDIYGDELDQYWDYMSSKDYGKDVIRHIRTDGFDRVAFLLKGAAPAPAAPDAGAAAPALPDLPPMPGPGGEAAPAPEAPAPEGEKSEKGSDTKKKIESALSTMEEKISELRDLASKSEDLVNIDVDIKSKDEKGKGGEAAAPTPMEGALASREDLMRVEALMNDSADELALISEAFDNMKSVDATFLKSASQALEDSELILSEAAMMVEAKKGAKCKGCGMLKQFCKCDKKDKGEKKEDKGEKEDKKEDKGEKKEEAKGKEDKKEDKKDEKEDKKKSEAQDLLDRALRVRSENRAALVARAVSVDEVLKQKGKDPAQFVEEELKEKEHKADDDCMSADCMNAEDFVVESDESVKSARRKAREELVAQAADKILGKYELSLDKAENTTEPTFFQAHPGGKGTVTDLTGTKTPEAKVETIEEIHDAMRDVAESGPRNVREAAMEIQESIVKGAFKVEDLDRLVAEGKVDGAAAAYWKKFWAQAKDAGSFGADLSKDFDKKKKEASDNTYKIKLRRAYDLGLEAQDKGLIDSTRTALDTYINDVMQFDDAAFESTKRIVAGMNSKKKSGAMPRVGTETESANQPMTALASAEPAKEVSVVDQLKALGWK